MATSDLRIPPLGAPGLPGPEESEVFRIGATTDSDMPNKIVFTSTGVHVLFSVKADTDNPVCVTKVIAHKIVADSSTGPATMTIGPTSGTGWLTDTVLKPDTSGTIQADIYTVYESDQEIEAAVATDDLSDIEMDLWVFYSLGRH